MTDDIAIREAGHDEAEALFDAADQARGYRRQAQLPHLRGGAPYGEEMRASPSPAKLDIQNRSPGGTGGSILDILSQPVDNAAMQRDPIVIIGGFGSDWRDYQALARMLAGIAGRRVFITHVTRATWVLGGFSDYKLLVDCAHQAVLHALRTTGESNVVLVGHSAGGVIGRGYLADKAIRPHHTPHHGHTRVSRLIMLGSPLRGGATSTQPGMRQAAWLDESYPGAYWPGVQYLTVRGRLIRGHLVGGAPREILAYRNYEFLGASGEEMGDGVVPESLAAVDGMPVMDIDGIGHSPLWGRWFGNDAAATRAWWQYFDVGDFTPDKVAYV